MAPAEGIPVTSKHVENAMEFELYKRISQWIILISIIFLVFIIHVYYAIFFIVLKKNSVHIPLSEKCKPNYYHFTEDLSGGTELTNGSFQFSDFLYPPGAFWTHNGKTVGCPCRFKTCIRKCCPHNQSFVSSHHLICVDDNSPSPIDEISRTVFQPLKKGQSLEDLRSETTERKDFHLVDSFGCNDPGPFGHGSKFTNIEETTFLTKEGTILTESLIYIDFNNYCLESIIGSVDILTIRCVHIDLIGYATKSKIVSFALHSLLFVSISCLIFSLAVYVKFPQLQNLNGKLLMSHMISVVGYYFSILTMEISPDIGQCARNAFILARTTWLTALCVELYATFSEPLLSYKNSQKSELRKFIIYSVFGWGLPVLNVLLILGVGVVPYRSDSCVKPRFEDEQCLFSMKKAPVLFTRLPTFFLHSINLIMFVFTLWNLRCYFNSSKQLPSTSKFYESNNEQLWVYIKVYLYMGTNWGINEVLFPEKLQILSIPFLFYTTAVYNLSQGIVLFILVIICNKRVLHLIRQRWVHVQSSRSS